METELLLQIIVAFIVSISTFFTGFGLGTVMLPLMLLSYDTLTAILATSIIHILNNLLKFGLLFKEIDKRVLFRFGIPSVIFAFVGANLISELSEIESYAKLLVDVLIFIFAFYDIIPKKQSNKQILERYQILGGALSGIFGGISGHQGAIRSSFLIKSGLSKAGYIATGTALSLFIDFTRIPVYVNEIGFANLNVSLLFIIISALLGVLIGRRFLEKTTNKTLKIIVALSLMAFGIYMIIT